MDDVRDCARGEFMVFKPVTPLQLPLKKGEGRYSMIDAMVIFITIAGFIIGLGAVTVIDLHGFLGRKSTYWTEATTRTHKVTKPMIWIGTILATIGSVALYRADGWTTLHIVQALILVALVINGIFLSFRVSPFLLAREKQGQSSKLLPKAWQRKIVMSFVVSCIGWWGSVALFVYYLAYVNK